MKLECTRLNTSEVIHGSLADAGEPMLTSLLPRIPAHNINTCGLASTSIVHTHKNAYIRPQSRITSIVADMQPGLQKDRLGCKRLSLQKMFVTVNKSSIYRKTFLIRSDDIIRWRTLKCYRRPRSATSTHQAVCLASVSNGVVRPQLHCIIIINFWDSFQKLSVRKNSFIVYCYDFISMIYFHFWFIFSI